MNIEQLAEIGTNAAAELDPSIRPWSDLNPNERIITTKAQETVITAFLESVPMEATEEDCREAWSIATDEPYEPKGIRAVMGLMQASHMKAIREQERKMIRVDAEAAEVEQTKQIWIAQHNADSQTVMEKDTRIRQLEAKLNAVKALPEKWKQYKEDGCVAWASRLEHVLSTPSAEEVKPEVSPVRGKWAAEKKAHAEGKRIEKIDKRWTIPGWVECGNPLWEHEPDIEYRVAPDPSAVIPRERLLELCGGREPHRRDGWTEGMLSDKIQKQRPLLKGEHVAPGDQWTSPQHHMEWRSQMGYKGLQAQAYSNAWFRTTRPVPAAPAAPVVDEAQADMMTVALLLEGSKKRTKELEAEVGRLADHVERLKLSDQNKLDGLTAYEAQVMELESRIAAISPRPISQKPTEAEMSPAGQVLMLDKNNYAYLCSGRNWDDIHNSWVCWIPLNLAKLCPYLVTKPEDKERALFDCWYASDDKYARAARAVGNTELVWQTWQAVGNSRAGKEAA